MPVGPTNRVFAVWLLVVFGCVLRLTALDLHSLWYDELATLHVARADDLVATLRADRHPPLSFLAFRVWIGLFGEDDRSLRLLPALVSSAALVAFVPASRRLVASPGAWLLSIALYACSPYLVWHGQEVRMYPFVELGAVVAVGAATAWLDEGRARAAVPLLLGVALASGSHYLGALSVAIVATGALCSPAAPPRRRLMVLVTAFVGFAVWLPWLLALLPDQLDTSWAHQAKIAPRDLLELPARLLLVEMAPVPAPWKHALLAPATIVLASVVLQFIRACRAATPPNERRASAMLAAGWLTALAPGAFGLLNFAPKYLIASSAPFAAVVAAGLLALQWRLLRSVAVAVILAGALALLGFHRTRNLREDHRAAIAELAAAWRAGEPVVAISGTPEPFSQAGLQHYLRHRPEIAASVVSADEVLADPARCTTGGARLHVVFRSAPYADPLLARLRAALRTEHDGTDRFRVRYLRLAARGR